MEILYYKGFIMTGLFTILGFLVTPLILTVHTVETSHVKCPFVDGKTNCQMAVISCKNGEWKETTYNPSTVQCRKYLNPEINPL